MGKEELTDMRHDHFLYSTHEIKDPVKGPKNNFHRADQLNLALKLDSFPASCKLSRQLFLDIRDMGVTVWFALPG